MDATAARPIPYRDEVLRKGIHIASAALPLFYWFTNLQVFLCVVIPLLVVSIVMEFIRHGRGPVRGWLETAAGHLFRPTERLTLSGSTYVLIANLVCSLLFVKQFAVASLLMMSISDAAASLVGRLVRGGLPGGKSIAGCMAFLVSAILIVLLVLPDNRLAGVAGAVVATAVELVPLRWGGIRIDDNLTIPLAAGTVMTLLG